MKNFKITLELDIYELEMMLTALGRISDAEQICAADRFTAAHIIEQLIGDEHPVEGRRIKWGNFRKKYSDYYNTIEFCNADGAANDTDDLQDNTMIQHYYIRAGHADVELA